MTDKTPMTAEEIEQLDAEQLPDREQMSLINANVAVPVDAAVSAQVLTDHSTSTADASHANQPITQQPNLRS